MVALRITCALLVTLWITAACSTTHNAGFCAIVSPIRPSAETIATMTDAEVTAILAQNEKGQKLCGWHP